MENNRLINYLSVGSSEIKAHKLNSFFIYLAFVFTVGIDGLGCELFVEVGEIVI